MRQFLSPKHILLYPALLILMLAQQSCSSQAEIRASFDESNEHEDGDSKLKYINEKGFNMAVSWMMGINGGYSNQASVNEAPEASGNGLAIAPQVEFIQKGSKFQESKTTLNYLNAIGDVVYRYQIRDKGTLYGGLGPYIGYGLGGHVKTGDFKQAAFGGDDGYKRFDAGVHLTAGYRLPMGLSLNLAYEWGLVNKSPASDYSSRNRTFSFQMGYSFQKIIDVFKKK